MPQGDARARKDRDFQSVLLRGGFDRSGASDAAEKRAAAGGPSDETYLERKIRGHQRVRTLFDAKRHDDSEVLFSHFEGRTEEEISRASGRFKEKLEIFNGRYQGAGLLEGLQGSV